MEPTSDLLTLIYEAQTISEHTVRHDFIKEILYLESQKNDKEIERLMPIMTQAEGQVLAQEGLWDRMKARGSQAAGAVKGMGNQALGAAQKGIAKGVAGAGNAMNKAGGGQNQYNAQNSAMYQKGQQNQQQGQMQGTQAKIDSYVRSIIGSVYKDIQKLGIQVNDPSGKQFYEGMLNLFEQSFAPVQGPSGEQYQFSGQNLPQQPQQ